MGGNLCQIVAHVEPDYYSALFHQVPRHADHAQVPAAVAREEQYNAARLAFRGINSDVPKRCAVGERAFRGETGQRQRTATQQGKPERFHFENISLRPPEISIETSSKTRGKAKPPGDARYFDSHIGLNFAL